MENCSPYVNNFTYNQSEMKFWHVKPRDYQHKTSLKNYKYQLKRGKFVLSNWRTVRIKARFFKR